MLGLLIALHIIVCILLIITVLLQSGRKADLSALGGFSSQTLFGPRGTATLLSKITTGLAILFMITSLSLWIFSAKGPSSVVGKVKANTTQTSNAGKSSK